MEGPRGSEARGGLEKKGNVNWKEKEKGKEEKRKGKKMGKMRREGKRGGKEKER